MDSEKMMQIKEVFDELKNSKVNIDDTGLDEFLESCMYHAHQFEKTGQVVALDKVLFLMNCVSKERELLKKGINQFIYLEDILNFLELPNIARSEIKLIELDAYPRTIPEDIVKVVEDTKDIFDKYYVLFTDYTGQVEKSILRERNQNNGDNMEKDPILFGTFQELKTRSVTMNQSTTARFLEADKINNKFYFLGDWVDEYCDLTLEKFVSMTSKDTVKKITVPTDNKEVAKEIDRLRVKLDGIVAEENSRWNNKFILFFQNILRKVKRN